jgi:hypothetical protein
MKDVKRMKNVKKNVVLRFWKSLATSVSGPAKVSEPLFFTNFTLFSSFMSRLLVTSAFHSEHTAGRRIN